MYTLFVSIFLSISVYFSFWKIYIHIHTSVFFLHKIHVILWSLKKYNISYYYYFLFLLFFFSHVWYVPIGLLAVPYNHCIMTLFSPKIGPSDKFEWIFDDFPIINGKFLLLLFFSRIKLLFVYFIKTPKHLVINLRYTNEILMDY